MKSYVQFFSLFAMSLAYRSTFNRRFLTAQNCHSLILNYFLTRIPGKHLVPALFFCALKLILLRHTFTFLVLIRSSRLDFYSLHERTEYIGHLTHSDPVARLIVTNRTDQSSIYESVILVPAKYGLKD
jgi:hypothetical protein